MPSESLKVPATGSSRTDAAAATAIILESKYLTLQLFILFQKNPH